MLFELIPGGFSDNKLEQLEFKLEKIIGIQKSAGKVTKGYNLPSWNDFLEKL